MRLGNMHAAHGDAHPMPGGESRRHRLKKNILEYTMELTHDAWAPPPGSIAPRRSATVVVGDFNMPIAAVHECMLEASSSVTWQVSDKDPAGNRDFMFSDGVVLTKISTLTALWNFEEVHRLVASSFTLRVGAPTSPVELDIESVELAVCVIAGHHDGSGGIQVGRASQEACSGSGDL